MRSLRRAVASALSAALLLGLAVASPVAAANNVIVLAYYGDCQFLGLQAGSGKTVKIEWRDADGALKSKHSVVSSSAGSFLSKCERDEEIERGDTIKTTIGKNSSPILTIPLLTAKFVRSTDQLWGKTVPNTDLAAELFTYNGTFRTTTEFTAFPTSDGTGMYTTGFGPAEAEGYDWGNVYWRNIRGDVVGRPFNVEGMTIWLGRAFVSAVGRTGEDVSFTLKSGSDVLAESGGTLWEGNNGFLFYDEDGDRVRTAPGNEVIGDFAADADIVLPTITATISKASDTVAANCGVGPGFGVMVRVHPRDYSKLGERTGMSGGSGVFSANFASAPAYNIVTGDKVDVYCKMATGDVVARSFTVG